MPPPLGHAGPLGISYRSSTDDDLPFLLEVYGSTRREELEVTGWPEAMKAAFLRQQFEAQHHHYRTYYPKAEWLIIEQEGAAIGRLYFEEWPSQFRIIDIAILPTSRGLGIGSAVLRDMLDMAADRGKAASIHVEKNNPAMRLYRRLGFASVEDKGVYDLMEWRPPAGAASKTMPE